MTTQVDAMHLAGIYSLQEHIFLCVVDVDGEEKNNNPGD